MLVETIASVFFIIFLIYFFWYRNLPMCRIGNFATSPGLFLLGHALYVNTSRKVLMYIHEQLMKTDGLLILSVGPRIFLYGSNYKFLEWVMSSTTFITKAEEYHPLEGWLGDGLLLSTGSLWKSRRKILTPAFHFKMIEKQIEALGKTSDILIQKLNAKTELDGFDVYPLISYFSLDTIGESAMSTSLNAQVNDSSQYVKATQNMCRIVIDRTFNIFKMFDVIYKLLPDYKVYLNSIDVIHKFDKSVIKERRRVLQEKTSSDLCEKDFEEKQKVVFLDILLTARDENGQPLADDSIRGEVDTIMFAGFETTSSAISFTLYCLASYPDVQKRVLQEQKELFGSELNPEVNYSKLSDMKYLEMVIKESMRLYPPVPFIARKITKDTHFDGKLLPKGLTIAVIIYSAHRNPEFFPDPEKFDPTRFDGNSKFPPYAYIPFSAGLRNCIGQKFAMVELKIAISKIIRNFEILPSTPAHNLELTGEATLKSANGIYIKLKRRIY